MHVKNDELACFYRVLAPYYDEDHRDLYGSRDIAFFLRVAQSSPGPVLEMGCGTGRVLLPLARAGVTVHGMDCSPEMLEQLEASLRAEPPEVRTRVTYSAGDIRYDYAGARFPLIIAPGHVLHSFLERDEQRAWLRNVRRHLAPGGAFCMDYFQFDYRRLSSPSDWILDVDRTDADTGNRIRRFFRCIQEPELQRFHIDMRWVVEDAGGNQVREDSAGITQRWFGRYELENLLELDGFRITGFWRSYSDPPPEEEAFERIILAVAADPT